MSYFPAPGTVKWRVPNADDKTAHCGHYFHFSQYNVNIICTTLHRVPCPCPTDTATARLQHSTTCSLLHQYHVFLRLRSEISHIYHHCTSAHQLILPLQLFHLYTLWCALTNAHVLRCSQNRMGNFISWSREEAGHTCPAPAAECGQATAALARLGAGLS